MEAPVQPQTAGRLSIDDILLSMGDKGKEIAKKAEQAKQEREQLRQELAEKAEQLRQGLYARDEGAGKARQEEERIRAEAPGGSKTSGAAASRGGRRTTA
ncbi:MAG: hypothetical protein ACLU3N_02240 [Lachnospiraceae bacterium]